MSDVPTTSVPDWQSVRLAVLLDALHGVPLSGSELASLRWLSGFEKNTVENVAAVINRARRTRGVRGFRVLRHAVCHVNTGK
jgi:hypothetical protein